MIGRRQPRDESPADTPAPSPERRPMREAECFKPSTFASRKAEAEKRAALAQAADRQMVRLGQTSHWMKDRRGKDIYVDAELFMEAGHPMRRYVRLEGDPHFYPLFDESHKDPQPVKLGTFSRRSVLPSAYSQTAREDVSFLP